MTDNNSTEDNIDWSLSTFEGARRESMRRWAQLSLEQIISALEEMEQLNTALNTAQTNNKSTAQENPGEYTSDKQCDN